MLKRCNNSRTWGSIVSTDSGSEKDVKSRLGKARVAFHMLDKLWKSKVISRHTKLKISNSNVKSVLLYGSETWRTTKQIQCKIQVFIGNCLRRIFNINWKDNISNKELWNMAEQDSMETTITRRKWTWIGHTMRKAGSNITKKALRWTPSRLSRQRKTKEHMEEDSWEGVGKHETGLERSGEQGTRSGGVAEYHRRPVLRQELKGKEEEDF